MAPIVTRVRDAIMCHREENNKKYIKVKINKEEESLDEGATVMKLLEQRGVKSRSSVWINGKQLLLSEYATYVIQENDQIKILRIVAGG